MRTELSTREQARQARRSRSAGREPQSGRQPSAGTGTRPRPQAPPLARPRARPLRRTPPPRSGPVRSGAATAGRPAAARRAGVPRTPFVLLVLALLGGGLTCLLVINTTLATASYHINNLQQANATLSQQEQALEQQIATDQAPGTIEHRAYQLGLRQQDHLTFLNARTGRIYRQPATLPGVLIVPGFTP